MRQRYEVIIHLTYLPKASVTSKAKACFTRPTGNYSYRSAYKVYYFDWALPRLTPNFSLQAFNLENSLKLTHLAYIYSCQLATILIYSTTSNCNHYIVNQLGAIVSNFCSSIIQQTCLLLKILLVVATFIDKIILTRASIVTT